MTLIQITGLPLYWIAILAGGWECLRSRGIWNKVGEGDSKAKQVRAQALDPDCLGFTSSLSLYWHLGQGTKPLGASILWPEKWEWWEWLWFRIVMRIELIHVKHLASEWNMVSAWVFFLIILEIVFWRVTLTWFRVMHILPFRVWFVIQWEEILNFNVVKFTNHLLYDLHFCVLRYFFLSQRHKVFPYLYLWKILHMSVIIHFMYDIR